MPVVVRDYEWSETDTTLVVSIPLKGVPAKKVDIYANDCYIKANYPPFFFELDLARTIDDAQSRTTCGEGYIRFELVKGTAGEHWGRIQYDPELDGVDALPLADRRKQAELRAEERAIEKEKARQLEKFNREQNMVRRQIEVERAERERIAALKSHERNEAEASVESWVQSTGAGVTSTVSTSSGIFGGRQMPGPRQVSEIKVAFTPRILPTPARETKDAEYVKYVKRAAQKKMGVATDVDRKEDEKNVMFLRDKGKQFFAQGNFEAAANAFTSALELAPVDLTALSNRAACYLKLAQYEHCIDDCDSVLYFTSKAGGGGVHSTDRKNMAPEEADALEARNNALRKKVFARRGAALLQSGENKRAIDDYRSAMELDPTDAHIQNDLALLLGK